MCLALLQYRNTPSCKDGQSPHRSFLLDQYRTLPAQCRSFAAEWQRDTLEAEQLAQRTVTQTEMYYNRHAQDLQGIQVRSTVALQDPRTKLWDIYGTVVNVSSHRRYSVKTRAGLVFIRNRRFQQCRSPASTITHGGGGLHLTQNSSQGAPVQHPQIVPPQEPRRSELTSRPPQRLTEDPQWP